MIEAMDFGSMNLPDLDFQIKGVFAMLWLRSKTDALNPTHSFHINSKKKQN
jgi:hypothetical protein